MDDKLQEMLAIKVQVAKDHLFNMGDMVQHYLREIEKASNELIADHRTKNLVSHMAMDFITIKGLNEEFSSFIEFLRDEVSVD